MVYHQAVCLCHYVLSLLFLSHGVNAVKMMVSNLSIRIPIITILEAFPIPHHRISSGIHAIIGIWRMVVSVGWNIFPAYFRNWWHTTIISSFNSPSFPFVFAVDLLLAVFQYFWTVFIKHLTLCVNVYRKAISEKQ